jgi:DNA polymerase III delta prime subunit
MEHHAYLFEGSQEQYGALVESARERWGFGTGSADVHLLQFEKFGIEDARALKETAALRSASERSLFVIGIAAATSESQQALLKLFEEPQPGTIFVLLMPHGAMLPTLRSRFLPYELENRPDFFVQEVSAFLKASATERSAIIVELLKDEEGVKERVRDFLNGLEAALYKKINVPQARAALEDIAHVRGYVGDRSPSLKMLLEHLALVVPKL